MVKKAKIPLSERRKNPKAFAFASGGAANRAGRRNMDIEQKKLHVPLVDKTPQVPPPIVVAVVGPPKTGKTTLIKCLVKRYTRQTLTEIKGPVTVVSGKKQRLTFIECSSDINAMIDIAKVADLILMTVDASFGFEMETFEFLNILQAHGFPKIMGVLTHLDSPKFKTNNNGLKKLKKVKKGAKLFYLSGLMNGSYPKTEILNLSRFISVMKFRPLVWRNTHSYMLADRFEDLTPEDLVESSHGKCDRTVSLYGYLRGANLKQESDVHIPGVGDLKIADVAVLPDPCEVAQVDPDKKRKRLDEKQKLIYAPMCDLGGLLYDKDAVYISVPGNFSAERNEDATEGERMVMNMHNTDETLSQKMKNSEIRLFANSALMKNVKEELEFDEDTSRVRRKAVFGDEDQFDVSDNEDEEDVDQDGTGVASKHEDSDADENVQFAESDSDFGLGDDDQDDVDDSSVPKWKLLMESRAIENFHKKRPVNMMDVIYGGGAQGPESDHGEYDSDGELFKPVKQKKKSNGIVDGFNVQFDSSFDKWENEDVLESLRGRFITSIGEEDEKDDIDGEVFGDFEDLEDEGETKEDSPENADNADEDEDEDELTKKKEILKKKFDAEYDDDDDDDQAATYFEEKKLEMAKQMELNRKAFENLDPTLRSQLEGYRAGQYVRIVLHDIPAEFVQNFDPSYPLIIGSLLPSETKYGIVQTRIKRHRWYKRILKNNDPLIFSVGWRRFQTLPIYSLNDGSRNRMLKYTPEHMHCLATFYGPATPPNTGFCCFQSVSDATGHFRVSATGVVLELDQTVSIVKKLKLTGVPMKILKNTAFIKDMFHSALEVAKFEGASIRTVSGIRGQIKKAQSNPAGSYRATFEDKILMSDIVFLRTWYPIQPKRYVNPVTNLLLSSSGAWSGMRLLRDIRKDNKVAIPDIEDSRYKSITDRPEVRKFNAFKVPKALQKELPFKSKPKLEKKRNPNKKLYIHKRAVLMEADEKKAVTLMQQINTIKNEKDRKKKRKDDERRKEYTKKKERLEAAKSEELKQQRKMAYRKLGQMQKRTGEGVNESAFKKTKLH